MNTLVAVSVVVSVVVLIAVAVYLILTLIQMRRTAREAEEFLRSLNQDVKKIEKIGDSISSFLSSFSRVPLLFKVLSGVSSAVAGFVVSKFNKKKSHCCQDGEEVKSAGGK